MDEKITLKNNIRQYRAEKNISQEELAKLVGTTRQTIIAVEKGQFNPSTKLALLISVALDVQIDKLFYLDWKYFYIWW